MPSLCSPCAESDTGEAWSRKASLAMCGVGVSVYGALGVPYDSMTPRDDRKAAVCRRLADGHGDTQLSRVACRGRWILVLVGGDTRNTYSSTGPAAAETLR